MSENYPPALLGKGDDDQIPSPIWIAMAVVVFVAFTVPFTTNWIQWANNNGIFPIRPAIYLVLTSMACIMFVIGRKPDFTLTSIIVLVFHLAYLFEATVLHRYSHPSGESYGMMKHGAMLLSIITLIWFLGVMHRTSHLPILIASALTIMVGSFSNIAEWFGLHSFSIVMGRAAGFHGDPNNSAIAIVLALAIFLTLSKNMWLSFCMLGISFIAVAITLSRSGFIAELAICISYLIASYRKRPVLVTKALTITVPAVIVVIVYLISNMSSEALQQSDIKDRLGALTGGDSQKMASGERMKDLTDGLNAVRMQPISGYGVGAGTSKWQPHNQLVAVWIDGGIIFGVLYLMILGSLTFKCVAMRGRGGLCLLALIIFIPFSQVLNNSIGYWMTAVILMNITSNRFYTIQWFKPAAPVKDLETHSPVNPTNTPSAYP